MGCKDRMELIRRGGVWSNGTTTSGVFVPLTEPLRVGEWDGARIEVELRASSGNIEVRRGVTYSDDGITWDTATTFGGTSWVTNTGFYYGTTFTAPDVSRRFFRLGMFGRNTGGTDIEEASCTLTVELANR